MTEISEIKQWEQALENVLDKFVKRHFAKGKYIKKDGVIDCAAFLKQKNEKILWILKEFDAVEGRENEAGDIRSDLRELALEGRLKPSWDKTRSRGYGPTYRKIIKTTEAIWHRKDPTEPWKVKSDGDAIREVLSQIAVINVKKYAGRSKSKDEEILDAYDNYKDLLLEQIAVINPDIIINASRVRNILGELNNSRAVVCRLGKRLYKFYIGTTKIKDKKCILVDTYHPAIHISDKIYIDSIRQCFEQLQEERC